MLSQEIENFREIFDRYRKTGAFLEPDFMGVVCQTLDHFAGQARQLEPEPVDPESLPPLSDADFGPRGASVIQIKGAH